MSKDRRLAPSASDPFHGSPESTEANACCQAAASTPDAGCSEQIEHTGIIKRCDRVSQSFDGSPFRPGDGKSAPGQGSKHDTFPARCKEVVGTTRFRDHDDRCRASRRLAVADAASFLGNAASANFLLPRRVVQVLSDAGDGTAAAAAPTRRCHVGPRYDAVCRSTGRVLSCRFATSCGRGSGAGF